MTFWVGYIPVGFTEKNKGCTTYSPVASCYGGPSGTLPGAFGD